MQILLDIDDSLLQTAMSSGHFKTPQDAVQAGLQILLRRGHARAHAQEVLKWEGRLTWDENPATSPETDPGIP